MDEQKIGNQKLKNTLIVVVIFLFVLLLSLFITKQWLQLQKLPEAIPVANDTAVNTYAPPKITMDDEEWAKEQQKIAIQEAKANPVFVFEGAIVSISSDNLELDIIDNPQYPVSGKQNIVVNQMTSIGKSVCTSPPAGQENAEFTSLCTAENSNMSALKPGDVMIVSIDKDVFIKENGKLVAKAILIK